MKQVHATEKMDDMSKGLKIATSTGEVAFDSA